jgi:opacity protein-like surface antigen
MCRATIAVFVTASIIAAPAAAQQNSVSFFVHGGGYTPLASFQSNPTVKFNTGFQVGGGVGVTLTDMWTIRGDFSFARNDGTDGRDTLPTINGHFNHFIYGLDVIFRIPVGGQVVPYISAGGGAITIDPDLTDKVEGTYGHYFTKATGRVGIGAQFSPEGSPFGILLDVQGLVYNFDQIELNKTQFDLLYSLGFLYRLPLGGG